ncbi:MAG: DUF1294 domain-containing protein [Fretibacterium sp.]|nr:DUF1294 domain-containing protein [Fretibacterium sp.]
MSSKMSLRSSPRTFFLFFAAIGIAATAAVLWKLGGKVLPFYPFFLLCSGIVTFFFYGYDKRQSRTGGWRVPELVLHLLSLMGGFIGGYLGRRFFRHKTQEPLFLAIIILSAILHAGIGVWVYFF